MENEFAKQAKRAYDRNQEEIAALIQQIQMALSTQAAQLRRAEYETGNGATWEHVCSLAEIKDKLQEAVIMAEVFGQEN